jgi:hypothetical protein
VSSSLILTGTSQNLFLVDQSNNILIDYACHAFGGWTLSNQSSRDDLGNSKSGHAHGRKNWFENVVVMVVVVVVHPVAFFLLRLPNRAASTNSKRAMLLFVLPFIAVCALT